MFTGLSPADQREALAGVTGDSSFHALSDAHTLRFVSSVAPKAALAALPKPPSVNMQQVDITGKPQSPIAALGAMPGSTPNPAPATDTMGKVAGGAIGAGALAAIGPAGLATIGRNALPFIAAEGINLARTKLGAAGKFIPPGAEILPFLVGGGKGKAAAAEGEATAETKAASATETQSAVPAKAPVPVPPAPKPARPPVPSGAEPDIEMEMRGAVDNPPTTQIKGVPDKLGTPAQEARMREAMVSRDTAKKALETGGAKAAEKQLVGPDPYAKNAPKMEAVQSTNVNKIGHDGKHLWVEYKSGQVYRYKDVPEEVFNQAKEADSVGSFLSRNVKGRYDTSLKGTARK